MTRRLLTPDLCVIGAGAAGLSVTAGCAQLGLSVVLIEAGEMGGDCLNTGCVPSKSLIAAANARHAARAALRFGIGDGTLPDVDWPAVKRHLTGVIEGIAPVDSQERFEGLGCTVLREPAAFTGPDTVETTSATIRARRFVVASGATAAVPPVPGLAEAPFLTNETIFALEALPGHLVVLGGGAIGVELGQAFARLGSRVTLIEAADLLGAADPEAVDLVRKSLTADGVQVLEQTRAARVEATEDGVRVALSTGGEVTGTHLLVATGRAARVGALGLDKAGVAFSTRGVTVDDQLRSVSNRRVWAVGDVAGREQMTHAAGWHAGVFIRSAIFRTPARASVAHMPSLVHCSPELGGIGLSEAAARAAHGDAVQIARIDLHDNDRARAERDTTGFCKLVLGKGGRILGATIVGTGAGETLHQVALAMSAGLSARAFTGIISPYPTRGEQVKRAAGAHFAKALFSPRGRMLAGLLNRLG